MKSRRFPGTARLARISLEKFAGSSRFPIRVNSTRQSSAMIMRDRAENIIYSFVIILGSMLLPVVCFGESFTIEQVLSAPFPYGLTTASHAPRVACVFDNKGERNIWVADAPGFVPRQVTHYKGDDGQAIASVRLIPDGKTIVYARGSETKKEGT